MHKQTTGDMMKETLVKTEQIFRFPPTALELHPLALSTPKMTDRNYEALKADIVENGQLEPVTLYRNRIVDGRHRWLILQELEAPFITAVKLPNNTGATELKRITKSKETRRHETPTQLAISAYKLMLDSDERMSISKAAEVVGADRRKVGLVRKITVEYKRPDIIDSLFNGEKVDVGDGYVAFYTDSLPAIEQWLKTITLKKSSTNTRGKVEMTEEQFIECAAIATKLEGLDIKMIKHLANRLYGYVKEYETTLAEKSAAMEEQLNNSNKGQ